MVTDEGGMVRTDDVVSARKLCRILGQTQREMRHTETYRTHDGDWRREPDGQWRFWYHAEVWAERQGEAA